jgi:2-phospho-L-lactate guanylyltransferase
VLRTAAILPVKRFSDAKQRLGASVDDGLRRRLAAAMVEDVLDALADAHELALTVVVTSEASVADGALARGALVVDDDAGGGQSAAAARGIARALREGAQRVVCVPGDCPALDPAELDTLLRERAGALTAAAARVVIVPDRHGTGTNGLLLSPPDAIGPSFGPDSCARHRALAEASGAACSVRRLASLMLDVDTGADLAALRERLSERPGRAQRTRAVLGDAPAFATGVGGGE